ncbi:relaxase/mobilization nuclease domain-containing protein [Neisseria gonorrhoeae]
MAVPMIVQFFNRGKGGGSGPIDYLLGKDRDREEARLLRGDPEETAALINSSDYAKKYTAGCLSFEESNIPAEQKHALMDSFEECIFAGLDKDQYNCLWVEHRDKGRLELNIVIPNIELLSGKRLQPYARIQRPRRPRQTAEHDPSQRPAEKHAGSRTEHHRASQTA